MLYADVLRVIATFAVIFIHVSAISMTGDIIGSSAWMTMSVYNMLCRWAVPMFVMLSGMFLLDPLKKITYKDIFFKYILRVLTALIVWGTFYNLVDHYGLKSISITTIAASLYRTLCADTHYHLWFLYLIIGLYIITPVLRSFIKGADKRDIEYYLIISIVVTCILRLLERDTVIGLWLSKLDLKMITGYSMYYVMGYYLKTYDLKKTVRTLIYGSAIVGLLGSVILDIVLSMDKNIINIPMFNDNLGLITLLVAVSIFIFFKDKEIRYSRFIDISAKISFGIYLTHDYCINVLYTLNIDTLSFAPVLSIPIIVIIVFILAFIVAYIIRKIPYVGKMLS